MSPSYFPCSLLNQPAEANQSYRRGCKYDDYDDGDDDGDDDDVKDDSNRKNVINIYSYIYTKAGRYVVISALEIHDLCLLIDRLNSSPPLLR